ncbi:hypothetical protein [Culicoidibacter larvae]|uniref:Uncharacterized protein n=1 Tax=Culicoidibacter larvae TaxID=2579976 RepID=A0A5R8Q6S5_9FIRM|nr:hypothetical protein [Culicoidibacter larvae]TLG71086.1 hypothetical protein FEZ08_11790 [Culicoidibacter larvae]
MEKKLRNWTNAMSIVGITISLLSIFMTYIPGFTMRFIQTSLAASGVTLTVISLLLKLFVINNKQKSIEQEF